MTRARDVADSALVHIKTETFSAASSVSINDVFNADYDNYKIIVDLSDLSADNTVRLKLRVSGSDASSDYYSAYNGIRIDGSAFTFNENNVSTGTLITTGDSGNDNLYGFIGDITEPFLVKATKFYGISASSTSTGLIASLSGIGVHYVATSYTGFSLVASTGTITGSIKVYGYRN